MKACEYISYYALNHQYSILWKNDPNCTVSDFLHDNPDYEIEDVEMDLFILPNERFALQQYLVKFSDETEIISMFREMFDNYRSEGGKAQDWLYFTFENISLNPQSIPARFRGIIEKNLIQWIDNYEKQPYDLLEINVKALKDRDYKTEPNAPTIAMFCKLLNDAKVFELGENESTIAFCLRVCEEFDLRYRDKVRQGFYNSTNHENFRKISKLIFPFIDSDISNRITEYWNNNNPKKQKMYG